MKAYSYAALIPWTKLAEYLVFAASLNLAIFDRVPILDFSIIQETLSSPSFFFL